MNAFAQRLQDREVPPDAHGARAYDRPRVEVPIEDEPGRVRLDVLGQAWTLADLQARVAREDSER
jgi:hypothetical protein